MSSKANFTVKIKMKWWLKYLYLPGLLFFGEIMYSAGIETEPNWDMIDKIIKKGTEFTCD